MTQHNTFEQNETALTCETQQPSTALRPASRKATNRGKWTIFGSVAGACMFGVLSLTSVGHLPTKTAHAQGMTSNNTQKTTIQQTTHPDSMVRGSTSAIKSNVVTSVSTVSLNYRDVARQAAARAGISPTLFERQIQQESGFNPNANSPVGAQGIAQFMPGTAAAMGVNPHDPVSALNGAARMMANTSAQFGGNYAKALAAYNAGAGAVQRAERVGGGNWLAYMPAETQHYVHTIMG